MTIIKYIMYALLISECIFILFALICAIFKIDEDDIRHYFQKKKPKKIINIYFKRENIPQEYKIFFNGLYICDLNKLNLNKNDILGSFFKLLLNSFVKYEYIYRVSDFAPTLSDEYEKYFTPLVKNKDSYNMFINVPDLKFLINSFLELNYLILLNEDNIKKLECNIQDMYNKDCRERYEEEVRTLKLKNVELIESFIELCKNSLEKSSKTEDTKNELKAQLLIQDSKDKLNSFSDKLSGYKNLMK